MKQALLWSIRLKDLKDVCPLVLSLPMMKTEKEKSKNSMLILCIEISVRKKITSR